MAVQWRLPAKLALAGTLLLSACAQPGTDTTLSPAENELRQADRQFNLTVAEGVGAGALLGAASGALISRNLTGALIGGVAGAAVGGGTGYLVARNNENRARTEADYRTLIASADRDAATYSRSAEASRQIAVAAEADSASLDRAYRERRVTAAQYAAQLDKYQKDNAIIQAQINDADQRAAAMRADAAASGPNDRNRLEASAATITEARNELARSADRISRALAARPQGAT